MFKRNTFNNSDFYTLLLIGIGAVPGSLIRYHIDNNLLVNIFGTLIMGFLMSLNLESKFKYLLCIGFCGSITTFSGWIMDCFQLISIGKVEESIFCFTSTILLGLLSISIGFFLGKIVRFSGLFQ